jgi:hypothetical protein
MRGYVDERCPCNKCFIQPACTDYCKVFHAYRALVIAEADFFVLSCDPQYDFTTENDQRFMTTIERDVSIVFNRLKSPKAKIVHDLGKVKRNLHFLSKRFDSILGNGNKAKRGAAMRSRHNFK